MQPCVTVKSEQSVEITTEDEGTLIRGSFDVLILKERFWILVVESKRVSFSVEEGLPQILSYMLGSPDLNQPCFGIITNGSSFIFLTLHRPIRAGILGSLSLR